MRPFTLADSPRVVDLVNADSLGSLGLKRAIRDGLGQVRLMRYVPTSAEKVVALDARGNIVGYAYLCNREQNLIYETGGAVHPDYHAQGIGGLLLNWAEECAAMLSQAAPADLKTVLQVNLFEAETPAQRLFTSAGYTHVRDWLHFEIELLSPPLSPQLPTGISLQLMDLDEDWDLVGPAMDEAFADHWGTIALAVTDEMDSAADDPDEADVGALEDESYSNSPGFCYYARVGDMVAGGVLCNAKLVERDDTGRVGSLFVRPAYRRLGVGRALMYAAFNAFWQSGLHRVILDTDAESLTAAPRFYSRLGMKVYLRERLFEKTIRPGLDLRRL